MPAAQVLQFDLRSGIDEGTDPKLQAAGVLTSLVNGVWRKQKRIDKRFGTRSLAKTVMGGGELTSAHRLVPRGDSLALVDNDYLRLWSSPTSSWRTIRQVPQYLPTWSNAVDTMRGVAVWDSAIVGNYEVIAWAGGDPLDSGTSGSLFVMVRLVSTGQVIMPPTDAGVGSVFNVRVVPDGSTLAHLVVNIAPNIKVVSLTVAAGALTVPTTLRTDASNALLDAMLVGGKLAIAYANNGVAPVVTLCTFTLYTWGAGATGFVTGEAATIISALAFDGDASDALYVAYAVSGGSTKIATANPTTLAQINAPATIEAMGSVHVAVTWISAGVALVQWSGSTGAPSASRASSCLYQGGAPDATTRRGTWHFWWTSRAVKLDGRYFAMATTRAQYPSGTSYAVEQPATVLVEIETMAKPAADWVPHRRVGTVDVLIGGWAPTRRALPKGYVASATQVTLFSPFQSSPTPTGTSARQGLRRVALKPRTLADDYARPIDFGGTTYLSTAQITTWDGQQCAELGFAHGPAILAATKGGAGTGSMGAGDYLYALVAEVRDGSGVLQRSVPCATVTVTSVVATGSVTLTIATEALDHHQADLSAAGTAARVTVTYALYRSRAGGSTLHRMTIDPSFNQTVNAPLNATVTFADTLADSGIAAGSPPTLGSRPPIYTTGDVKEDRQPISGVSLHGHQGRLWQIDGSRRQAWFSKLFIDDPTVAAGFHESFMFAFDAELVAIHGLDDKVIFFGESRIWWTQGEGPAANGQGGYAVPVALHGDLGCVNPRSIAIVPAGLMFESTRGICLLTRGLEVQLIGQPVEDTLAAFPNITSAVTVTRHNQVRITCNNAGATGGRVIVFDYSTGQWSTFEYWDADAGVSGTPIADACIWQDRWTFVTPAGKVYYEDESTFLDNGTRWVAQSGVIAWVAADGPLGFQRVRRAFLLGDRYTDCDLTLSFGFDHDEAFAQSYTWKSDKLAEFADGANIGMRVGSQGGANPRCRAFRLRWTDATPTGAGATVGSGQGCNFSAIGLEIVPKPGMDRRSARQRA